MKKARELKLELSVDGGDLAFGVTPSPSFLVIPMYPASAKTILRRMRLVSKTEATDKHLYKMEFWDWSVKAVDHGKEVRIDAPTMSVDKDCVWWTVSQHHTGIYLSTKAVSADKIREFSKS